MRINADDTDLDVDGCVLYDGTPYTGEVEETAPNGQVIAITSYYKGFEDGPTREWYRDGTKRVEGESRFGVGAVGLWREWHPNGRLAVERGFSERGQQLYLRGWDEAGVLVEDKTY